jgi:transcriptional regulator with XRE-family HTH domain
MADYADSSPGVVALLLDDIAPPRLGTLLRAARKQRSLTRREVASRVDTTPSALRRYERGDAPVPPSLVAQLAECYGEDLAAQFATRAPLQLDTNTIVVGDEAQELESTDSDEVLGTYVAIVARLRRSQPGTPIALRADDVVALSSALGQPSEHVEQRIVEMLGCTPHEAHSLHAEMLRRKLVVPVAGLVTGLAVITGVGVGVSHAATSSPAPASPTQPQVVRVIDVTPTASEVAATRATLPDADPAPTSVATVPVVASTPVPQPEPVATPAPAAAPAATPAVAPAATPAATPAAAPAEPAAKPVPRPVIEPDDTPMSVPPHETVTIIQP